MKYILILIAFISVINMQAQETVYPAVPQKGTIALTHATIHIGNGEVINDGTIVFSNGKITGVGATADVAGAQVIDCSGKQIYPGLIAPVTSLGLVEIGAVGATRDDNELGDLNPDVRSLIAYNTDSKIINTLRSNGILLANVVPEGGILSGSSSVVQLDAWNWEDAAYKTDGGIHFRMPSLAPPQYVPKNGPKTDRVKDALDKVDIVRSFFREAKAYFAESKHEHTNLKFESVRKLFDGSQIFYVHCDLVKEMLIAAEFAKEFGFKTVIIGGADSWCIADYLKQNNIAVILDSPHAMPIIQDDDIAQPNKTPYLLQQAGVQFCMADQDGSTRGRNLMFSAGNTAGYGLTKEQALQAITLNTAKILGIDATTGSLEKGKDANIVVSSGDILDMKTNNVTLAFIQGRNINLDNKQKQLYERYMYKYGLK